MASAFSVEYTVIHLTDLSSCRKPYQNTRSWAGCLTRMGRQSTTSDRWKECSWAWEAQPKRLHGTGDPLGCSWQEPQMYLCSQISTDLSLGESDYHRAQLSTVSCLIACCKQQIKVYQVSRYHHDRWQRLAWSNNCYQHFPLAALWIQFLVFHTSLHTDPSHYVLQCLFQQLKESLKMTFYFLEVILFPMRDWLCFRCGFL